MEPSPPLEDRSSRATAAMRRWLAAKCAAPEPRRSASPCRSSLLARQRHATSECIEELRQGCCVDAATRDDVRMHAVDVNEDVLGRLGDSLQPLVARGPAPRPVRLNESGIGQGEFARRPGPGWCRSRTLASRSSRRPACDIGGASRGARSPRRRRRPLPRTSHSSGRSRRWPRRGRTRRRRRSATDISADRARSDSVAR